jgi:hypothetical protein
MPAEGSSEKVNKIYFKNSEERNERKRDGLKLP